MRCPYSSTDSTIVKGVSRLIVKALLTTESRSARRRRGGERDKEPSGKARAARVLCATAGNGVGCEEHECACAAQGGSQLGCAHVNHAVLRGVLEIEKAP